MQRRTRTSTAAVGLAVALLLTVAAAVGSQPAGAAYTGVKSMHFDDVPDLCLVGQAYPCTTNAGTGAANQVHIRQHAVGGSYRFDQFDTTSDLADRIWLGAEIGAECKAGYKLWDADIGLGHRTYDGEWLPEEVVDGWPGIDISTPSAKTMPTKTIAINVPVDEVFANGGYVYGFPDVEDVFEEGEERIDDRMDGGLGEGAARALGFEVATGVRTNARVICRANEGFHRKYEKAVSLTIPLRFAYEPIPPVGDAHRPSGGLTTAPRVTGVAVEAAYERGESCAIQVSGVIEVDRTTDVSYRLIDSYGQQSNLIQRRVLAWLPLTIHHEIGIDDGELDGIGFTSGGGDGIGGLTDEPDAELEGTVRIKIVSPNLTYSNVDGWQIEHALVESC